MLPATWAGIGALILVNIAGWLLSYVRYARSEGKAIGRMEGKVDSLCKEVTGMKKEMTDLNSRCGRIEGRLNGMSVALEPKQEPRQRRRQ